MARHIVLPTSLILATGGILGLASFIMPWFYLTETGTPVFNGQWGIGPLYYSESPVKEDPQTAAGLLLLQNMAYRNTPYGIWHDLSYWSMIAALVSIILISLVRKKAPSRSLRSSGLYFISSSLMILSLIAWAQYIEAAVENACLDSTCLSGLTGQWTSPTGPGTIHWGLNIGFFVAIVAAVLLGLAGSSGFLDNRPQVVQIYPGSPKPSSGLTPIS